MKLKYSHILLFLSFCGYIAAYLQFRIHANQFVIAMSWVREFYVILIVSAVLSLLLLVIHQKVVTMLILILKGILFLVAGYPLGQYLGVEFSLLTVLVLEMGNYLQLRSSIVFSLVVASLSIYYQKPNLAWFKEVSAPKFVDIFGYALYSALVIFVSNFLKYISVKMCDHAELIHRLDLTIAQLSNANRDFQQHALTVKKKTEIDERKRISRDIHDTVGYTLTNLMVMMESATDFSRTQPEKAEELLILAIDQARTGLEETRHSLRRLRSIYTEEPVGIDGVQRLTKTFEQVTGVQVVVDYANLPRSVSSEIDDVIYHIVQEGLINAFRHGKATQVKIYFWLDEAQVKIYISDNGSGSAAIKDGIGFSGMKERISHLGGQFNAQNVTYGFEIAVSIPLRGSE